MKHQMVTFIILLQIHFSIESICQLTQQIDFYNQFKAVLQLTYAMSFLNESPNY